MGLGYFNGEYLDYINESAKKYKYKSINWNDYLDAQLNIPQNTAEKLGIKDVWMDETNSYLVHSDVYKLADEIYKLYEKKFIEEEMKMSVEQFDNLRRLIKSLGGTVDLDYSRCGYEGCRINLPIEKLKWIKVALPETNFDKYKIPKKWGYEGTDIPPVTNVETYNNRVVKVTFADGSFTKSVCSENDTFNLDVGISVCITKRMMGKDGHKNYNNMMRKVHEQMIKNAKDEVAKKAKIQEEKEKRKKDNEQKAEKKDRAKKEIIDIQKTAMLSALEEFHSKTGDDGK